VKREQTFEKCDSQILSVRTPIDQTTIRAPTTTAPRATTEEAHPPTAKAEAELLEDVGLAEAELEAAMEETCRRVRDSEEVVDAADEPVPVVLVAVPEVLATELVEVLVVDELFVVDADAPLLVETWLAAVLDPDTVEEVGLEEMGNDGLEA